MAHDQHSADLSSHSLASHSINDSSDQGFPDPNAPVPIHTTSTGREHSSVLEKQASKSSTKSDKSQLLCPRKQRRGILAHFSIIREYKDAREYPARLKGIITFVVSFACLIGPMGTSIVFPAIENMTNDLHTSTMMINVSVGIYLLSIGIFPLWWSTFSEIYGRRSIYIISFTMYLGFCVGCSLAPNINALIVFRVLTGGCSASVQSVGAGTISDLYAPEQRGRALGYFYLGALMAPLASPIIGSLLLIRWSWRATQWFMVIAAFVILCFVILLLPETLRVNDNKAFIAKILAERRAQGKKQDVEPVTSTTSPVEEDDVPDDQIERIMTGLSRTGSTIERVQEGPSATVVPEMFISEDRSNGDPDTNNLLLSVHQNDLRRLRTEVESLISGKKLTKMELIKKHTYQSLIRPMKAVYFLKYPPVLFAIIFSAISFFVLYIVNMTIQYEFSRAPYNWKSLYVGFAYIPNSVTYIFASIYGGKWTDYLFRRQKEKHGFATPESRISYNILSAVVTFPIALLIIGWCFHFHKIWVSPLIGTAIFGYASMMTIGPVVTYIVDSLPGRGATGVALNNLVRQTLATIAVFVVDPMIIGMGVGPMYSMLAGVILVSALSLVILKKRGTYWRENFDLQKLYDELD